MTTTMEPFQCPFSNGNFPVSPFACEADFYLCVDYMPYQQVSFIKKI